ncbi:hypothetical protein [Desulfotalea psychrophila]|uniref:Lipoprotein n=1 Tax=Desulfotalea psychrophila (strain LSv54 / DSM 12343) TaxID=177439 RepID=Q6ANQ3_DESPS|nr:hypothetical protein [Desulfotalea psychrophila]CAG36021.1 unknown protein [Desulfotalea psychrophila LSv54]
MRFFKKSILLLPLLLLVGCGHSINITPPLNYLSKSNIVKIDKNVGYFISKENFAKEVSTPGGGGDKVKYFPYREAEPALKKVLSNVFEGVYKLSSEVDILSASSKKISYIFTPQFITHSSSSSVFTWPPTLFSITIDCKAVDKDGKITWQTKVTGEGEAEFSEFKHDMSLAAKRATKNAFIKLQDEILTSRKF